MRLNLLSTCIYSILLMIVAMSPVVYAQQAAPGGYRVLIDPAHGGADPGVSLSGKTNEKDITLAVAVSLKKVLVESDRRVTVQLTRSSDKAVSLAERRNMVNSFKADLLISLHANAGFGPEASGFEISLPGLKNVGTGEANGIVKNMEKTKHANESIRLANLVQKNLETVFPRKGRGVREVPVPLLISLNVPSICVEIGFLTNKNDKNKLLDQNGQKDIARAIGRGIRDYFNQ